MLQRWDWEQGQQDLISHKRKGLVSILLCRLKPSEGQANVTQMGVLLDFSEDELRTSDVLTWEIAIFIYG